MRRFATAVLVALGLVAMVGWAVSPKKELDGQCLDPFDIVQFLEERLGSPKLDSFSQRIALARASSRVA